LCVLVVPSIEVDARAIGEVHILLRWPAKLTWNQHLF
jgi:hypothetical protein